MNNPNDKINKRSLLWRALLALILLVCLITALNFLFLVIMAIPATQVLIKMEDTTKSDLTIRVTGRQWRWHYEYLDSGINFFSAPADRYENLRRLDPNPIAPQRTKKSLSIDVDNVLLVPSGRKVRTLITANDVIHSWWIPAFGTKKDAIPGYINELWFNVSEGKEGIYRGQCAELCGKGHLYMPVVVKVITGAEFDAWLAAGGNPNAYAAGNLTSE